MSTAKKYVDKVVEWLCILLLGIMTVLVTYQVITRYFFNAPSAISEVLAKYLFVWLVLLCGAYVFGLREHMNIGFVRDKFPPRARIGLEMFGELIIALFALGVMLYGGAQSAIKQMIQLDSALQIPMGIIYVIVPVSGLLMLFYFVYNEMLLAKQLSTIGKKA